MAYVLMPLLLVGFVLLVVRPQQQRIKAQQAVVASLEVGDQVLSASGIFGTITQLDDDVAVLRVADGVELRMARGALTRKVEIAEPAEPRLGPDRRDDDAARADPTGGSGPSALDDSPADLATDADTEPGTGGR